jgi:SIR2-like domain
MARGSGERGAADIGCQIQESARSTVAVCVWKRVELEAVRSWGRCLVKPDRCGIYYTTDYDDFIERALKKVGRNTHITSSELNIRHDRSLVEVVKFHGDFNTPEQMVLSESQYMDRMRLESPMDFKLRADMRPRSSSQDAQSEE